MISTRANLSQAPVGAAVIFDMDGCLVDSEPLCLEAIASQMRKAGLTGANSDMVRDCFLGIGISEIARFVQAETGHTNLDGFAARVEASLRERYAANLNLIDGVIPLLEHLDELGLGTAIATGASRERMGFTLDASGLANCFHGSAHCVDDVERGKPAPDLFFFAAMKANVSPVKCLVLEDSPHGISGAVAAGMTAVGFVGGTHLRGKVDAQEKALRDAGAITTFRTLDAFGEFVADWAEVEKTKQRGMA